MFTGLVEEQGTVAGLQKRGKSVMISLKGRRAIPSLRVNDSIAVDGVCLTVVRKRKGIAEVQAVEETLRKTTLGSLARGSAVNLERSMKASARVGGHFVLGHVDGIGRIREIIKRKNSWILWIQVPARFAKYLIPVGSVAVNGVSLTVADLKGNAFAVSIIPHTWNVTTMKKLKERDRVNIEFDVLGKYVERLVTMAKRRRRR